MEEKITGKRFLAVTLLNVLITIVEIIGGLVSGSLALLSDAFHNMGDSFSIVLGYFAQHLGSRPETKQRTYGYRRAEILSALTNSLLLIIIAIFLIGEAIQRLGHPEHINGGIMLTVAIVGLVANLVSALLLHSGSHDSLNVKATYLHVLSDALSSVAVIIGGVILTFVNVPWLDPALTIGVALYIGYESWPIIVQTVKILMQSSPDLDYEQIAADIKQVPGVEDVHHVHAWMIDEHRIIFSAHLNCQDLLLSQVEPIYAQVEDILRHKYGICHITLQAECARGRDEELFNTPVDEEHVIRPGGYKASSEPEK
ncbi:cation diffusion facilitator family transporter [Limosilactobacillus sp.]|jgi:cobalt-zinc-cadmium efflux system protein|uniref:cation diffusion facilitator family transporter n=1 Tax=Limosilactobacillus sp. TaxID=2773925 RepID=UPI0025C31581|nr:cation diffusion facilitator family transporter [Limosilactobacillus sp.]MCH3921289.1 cation diffusion facilitator family transporter [Limosilactobacillus sp.]MCH3928060.1 cation diffusion facilitator family transporter [Limosilactobacillus sp.]